MGNSKKGRSHTRTALADAAAKESLHSSRPLHTPVDMSSLANRMPAITVDVSGIGFAQGDMAEENKALPTELRSRATPRVSRMSAWTDTVQATSPVVHAHLDKLRSSSQLLIAIHDRAAMLVAEAASHEPRVTALLTLLAAQHGGQLAGLEFRLKGIDSLFRKLQVLFGKARSERRDVAIGSLGCYDTLRYTMTFEVDDYAAGIRAVLAGLAAEDVRPSQLINYWPIADGDHTQYRGINGRFMLNASDEARTYEFELQFHTPDSLSCKNFKAHLLYERYRTLQSAEEKRAMFIQMLGSFESVPVPRDATSIGKLCAYPPPPGCVAMLPNEAAAWDRLQTAISPYCRELMGACAEIEPETSLCMSYLARRFHASLADMDDRLKSEQSLARYAHSVFMKKNERGRPTSYAQVRLYAVLAECRCS